MRMETKKLDLEGDEPITIDDCFLRTQARRCSLPFAMAGKRNGPLISPLCVLRKKMIILPRQARDKQRESLRNEINLMRFLSVIHTVRRSKRSTTTTRTDTRSRPPGRTSTLRSQRRWARCENRLATLFAFHTKTRPFQTKTVFTYGLFSVPKRTGFLFVLLLVCSLSRACIGKMIVLQ